MKTPLAIGLTLCSTIPNLTVLVVRHLELNNTVRSYKHIPLTIGATPFFDNYWISILLPVLTAAWGLWCVFGKSFTPVRGAWTLMSLAVIHILWFSYGVLALYVTVQSFMA